MAMENGLYRLAPLATALMLAGALMTLFAWLSRKPGNEVVYYPNRILRGLDPWEGGRGARDPFAWIREAWGATEEDVVRAAGVDTAVYLIFLRSVLMILFFSGIILLPVLLPLAVTDHGVAIVIWKNPKTVTFNNLDKLAMGNIKEKSHRLWAFLLATYWVTFVTIYVLWTAYKHVLDLRVATKAGPEAKPEDFTILVRDIPPPQGQNWEEHVDSYFKALHPETYYKSMVVTDGKKANKIWEELEGYKKKLAHAKYVFTESKTTSKPDCTRPTNKTGFLGLIGTKVDTIDHCNEKIKELLTKLEAEQKLTLREKQKAAALVFFNSRSAAASASQTFHAKMCDTWTIMEAPEPRQLLWTNLTKSFHERQTRQYVVYGIVFLTVVFYMIPITFVSALATLQNLRLYLPFLKVVVDQPEIKIILIKIILEAFVPQVALLVFMALLPPFLMFLSKAEGIPSQSHAIRAASEKYFYFIVFNVFLGVTVVEALIKSLKIIVKDTTQIVSLLGGSLPGSATLFIAYAALKFFVGYAFELSRLLPLTTFYLKKKYLCKTEAEVKEAWAPGELSFATRVPNDMLVVTVTLCYLVIAPLIIPFSILYFGLGWLVARNQAIKVCVPSYESYGQMWPHMHARILAALIIYQVTMLGFFGVKEFYYAPLVLPLIVMSFIFAHVCKKRYYPAFAYTPLELASRELKEPPNMESIYAAYIPPWLRPQKLEDMDQFKDAQSQASRTTSF